MKKIFPLLVAFFILGNPVSYAQGVPDYFLIQGQLVSQNLDAHTGLYDFQISFWGDADADDANPTDMTEAYWSEQRSIEVDPGGYFEFKIGDQTALPNPFNFDTLKYLQIDARPALGSNFTILDPLRDNSEIDRRALITVPYRSLTQENLPDNLVYLNEDGKIDSSLLPDSLNTTLLGLSSRISSTENSIASFSTQITELQAQVAYLNQYAHTHKKAKDFIPVAVFVDGFGQAQESIELFETRILNLEEQLKQAQNGNTPLPNVLPDLSIKLQQAKKDGSQIENQIQTLANDSEDYTNLKKRMGMIEGATAILERYKQSDQISKERIQTLEENYKALQAQIRLIETTPRVIKLGNETITAESVLIAQENSEDIITLDTKIQELEGALLEIAEINKELASIKTLIESNESRISALEDREANRTWKDPVNSLNDLRGINGQQGEIRYVVDESSLQVFNGDDWKGIGGGETGSLKQNTYSFAQIINIHTKREGQPGLFYWDRGNKEYFVGLADGSLKSLFGEVPLPGFIQQEEWTDLRFVNIASRGFEKTNSLQYLQDDRLGIGFRSGFPDSWNEGMAIPELAFDREEEKTVEYVFYSGSLDGRMMIGIADSDNTNVNGLGGKGYQHQKFALYMQSGSLSNKIFGQTKQGDIWNDTFYKKSPWLRESFYRVSFTVDKKKGIKGNLKIDQVDEKNFDQIITNITDQPIHNLAFDGERFMPMILSHGNNSYRLAGVRVRDTNTPE